ncbi:MAG TPA: AAA family ATPase [Solirubrobacteraceae bacterium]|nr:AAA family ATPase [Solirubrobacteraceae bacterium]
MNVGTGSLVGRDRELAELRQGLDNALAGRGRLFMVAGDPGVGKTALADAIGTEAVVAGATVLWGRAWDGGGAPAYWPWLRILRRLASQRDITEALGALGPEATGRLTRLIPSLARAPEHLAGGEHAGAAPAADDPGESDAARFQLFDAITSLLRASAAQGPIVLILDDLHGADHPSLLLLGFLAVHLRDSPILVIGTYRETEARLDPQLAATLGDIIRHGRRLPLRGLRERDVAEVVERVAGRRPPDRVVRVIHDATEGNPFFVDEVVRLLSAEGRLDEVTQVTGVRIPDGVRETIRHRLEPLPERTLRLLYTASVIGRAFRIDTLQRVTGTDPAELDEALGPAVGCGVIAERAAALGVYAFSHGLIRETLYDDLGPQRRGRLHREVGLVLEELYAADPEPRVAELAHHFHAAATAGELDKAIDYSVRAGQRAMKLVAYEEAADHFERALQTFGLQRIDLSRRLDLLLALGSARSRAGDSRAARETFLRAARLARRLGSSERLAKAALGYGAGMGGFEFGRVDEGLVALLAEAREALGEEDGPLLARVLGRQATELYFSDRDEERVALGERAVEMARRIGDRATLASTLSARFLTLWGPENSPRRLQIASDVIALGEEVRDRELVLRGHVWRIVSLMELGDWVGADIELAVHARLAEELRDPLHLWYVPLFRATRALLEGRLVDAERYAGEAFAIGRRTQAQNAAQLYAVQLFALRAEQGRLSEVGQSLSEFGRRYPAAPVWRAAAAFSLTVLGRNDDARRSFESMTATQVAEIPRDGEWLSTVALLIRTGARIGAAGRTGELGKLLAPYTERAVIAGRGAICLGPVSRFAGIAAATAGRTTEAIELLEHALAMARRWGAEPMVAGIRLELAEVLDRAMSESGSVEHEQRLRELRAEAMESARRLELVGLEERWGAEGSVSVTRHAGGVAAPAPGVVATSPVVVAGVAASAFGPMAFYRRGDIWTIGPTGSQIHLRDAKGLAHVARLLAAPHVEFHALDLVGFASPQRAEGAAAAVIDTGMQIRPRGENDAGPVLDSQAKAAYRARVSALHAEIDEAESFNDPRRADRAREELAFLARELAGAVGLHGRDRKSGSDAERARVNVTRAIRTALKRVSEHDEALGRRLGAAIRTGTFCVYEPSPGEEPVWDLVGPV